jgi:hypothetical protein
VWRTVGCSSMGWRTISVENTGVENYSVENYKCGELQVWRTVGCSSMRLRIMGSSIMRWRSTGRKQNSQKFDLRGKKCYRKLTCLVKVSNLVKTVPN